MTPVDPTLRLPIFLLRDALPAIVLFFYLLRFDGFPRH
jgi:hypothetical protein